MAPSAVVTVRTFEYWGCWVTPRTQPYCLGDKLPSMYNKTGIANPSKEAQYLTGNLCHTAYSTEMLRDPATELQSISRQTRFFNGHLKYAVSPATAKDVNITRDVFNAMYANPDQKDLMFNIIIKDYPRLKVPLDAETKQKFLDFYKQAIDNALDEEAVNALAKPFVQNMHEQKYISMTYWWRFSESLAAALEAQPSLHRSAKRSYRLVTERVTKIMLNTLADHPWSHDETTSPYLYDVCGHRAMHEAGWW
jgi:hypothetical protein